ncbi:MAG TPA: 23S rRNA (uracil(1939)-C(5))-methyltransferase RlmD [Limnochordales bacterium]
MAHHEPSAGGPELHPGRLVELDVEDVDVHGDGVARTPGGLVVFVEGALAGEKVLARVVERHRHYARARLERVLAAWEGRVAAPCPVAGRCGGCPLMVMAYDRQLAHKRRLVEESLLRLGQLEAERVRVLPTLGMDDPWRYRNRAQYPVARGPDGRVVLGFFRRGTHQVVPVEDCLVSHPTVVALARAGRRAVEELGLAPYDEQTHSGAIRHLVCRVGHGTGQALAVVVTRTEEVAGLQELPARLRQQVDGLVGVVQNLNPHRTNVILGTTNRLLWGQPHFEERVGELRLRISATAFFQVNTPQTHRLYGLVEQAVARLRRLAGMPVRLWDLYCGVGGIGLYCARHAGEVVGIEEHPTAVHDARYNARANGFGHAHFVVGQVEQVLRGWTGPEPDWAEAVVVDPPRAGLAAEALRAVVERAPRLWVYVSCHPATLARDLGLFLRWSAQRGLRYRLDPVQPVDMFPHTAHVETVACLWREPGPEG